MIPFVQAVTVTFLSRRYEERFGIDHAEVVEACAPRGIHVMAEKPRAVSVSHARRMAELAKENDILLLTNYETTSHPPSEGRPLSFPPIFRPWSST